MELEPGARVGQYEILAPLGAGGMGEIYRARDTRLERDVALKILPAGLAADPGSLRRFEREARSLAALNHPNIVAIHSVEEQDGLHFLTMELVEGKTLDQLISKEGLDLETFLSVVTPLGSALAAAHEAGIVHRDLKPGNVMVTDDGRVKVLDFGLAKRPARGTAPDDRTLELLTQEGMIVGTGPYMSPEQVEGRSVDPRSDIFSLGVVMYEMLAGRRPFRGDSLVGVISAILRDQPEPLESTRPGVPPELSVIVARCLEKNPPERYSSVSELLADLNRIESRPADLVPNRSRSSSRWLWIPAMITSVLLLIGFGLFLSRTPEPGPDGPGGAAGKIDSLAVLPLTNVSDASEQDYLAEAMTEAIINNLAMLEGLKVISRTSVTRYADSDRLISEIADELGVRGIVEGSVQRVGDRVRVHVRLVDAVSDENVWADSFEDRMRNILALQSRVARGIARRIAVTVSPDVERRLETFSEVDPEAYEAYLEGRSIWSRPGGLSGEKSIEAFRKAIRIDPDYARAHAALAEVYLTSAHFGRPPHEAMPLAKEEALRALELDPSLAQAHAAYADAVFHYDWDWTLAEQEFQRAIELNPGYSVARWWYSGLLAALGRHEEATRQIAMAQELDPIMPGAAIRAFALRLHYWARRYDLVEETATRFAERDEEVDLEAQMLAGWLSAALGGGEISAEDLELLRESSSPLSAVGIAAVGDEAEAREALVELEEIYQSRYISPYMIAIGWAFLEEDERALDWIEIAVDDRAADLIWINVEPAFDSIRDHPRFQEVIRIMGFPSSSG